MEQKEMLEKFQWAECEDKTGLCEGEDVCAKIEECAQAVLQVSMDSMSTSSYNGEEIIIPIPDGTHELLQHIMGDNIKEESQEKVLNIIQHVFFSKAWSDRLILEEKINNNILKVNPSLKHMWYIENIWLHLNLIDCPIVDYVESEDDRADALIQGQDDQSTKLQVEITLQLKDNPNYDPNYETKCEVDTQ